MKEVISIAIDLLRGMCQRRLFEMVRDEVEARNLEPILERYCPSDRFVVIPGGKIFIPWGWYRQDLGEEMCA